MNVRQKLTPQMHDYDNLAHEWHPYVMFLSRPNYISEVVNTDSLGFRKSKFQGENVSTANSVNYDKASILVGGSSAFGVGSTSDSKTLSSLLGNILMEPWLNFGGRAFNSTQEFILFSKNISNLPKISKVVLFSGLNNLYLSQYYERNYPPFFFSNHFYLNMELSSKKYLSNVIKKQINNKWDHSRDLHLSNAVSATLNDLYLWKKFSEALNFEIFFVLQPFAHWLKSNVSPEEASLFKYLDSRRDRGVPWSELSSKYIYNNYSSPISDYCRDNEIKYIDMNAKLPTDEWYFVDRVHLTDRGYEKVAEVVSDFIG